ncbi:hypothetical protein KIN20_033792 [Parelaphostrongylus tenuis]|uniref:Uncharacterized protein n=1 Tax=Parelaphostrongylus tenuis TaxID=148309 RepID=A0AAD5R8M6_PARTN|nr:hypothetical protein KIN20_033792 [Parelaphostrongylus tenuis]
MIAVGQAVTNALIGNKALNIDPENVLIRKNERSIMRLRVRANIHFLPLSEMNQKSLCVLLRLKVINYGRKSMKHILECIVANYVGLHGTRQRLGINFYESVGISLAPSTTTEIYWKFEDVVLSSGFQSVYNEQVAMK